MQAVAPASTPVFLEFKAILFTFIKLNTDEVNSEHSSSTDAKKASVSIANGEYTGLLHYY